MVGVAVVWRVWVIKPQSLRNSHAAASHAHEDVATYQEFIDGDLQGDIGSHWDVAILEDFEAVGSSRSNLFFHP
jgi:hypothetical protein